MKLTAVGKCAILLNECGFCEAPRGKPCVATAGYGSPESSRNDWPHGVHHAGPAPMARGMLVEEIKNSLQYKMLEAAGELDNLD